MQVVRRVLGRQVVLLDTEDGLEAEVFVRRLRDRDWDYTLEIRGVHASHDYADGRCRNCGAFSGACYASHFPCGFVFEKSLRAYMADRMAGHTKAGAEGR